MSYLDNLENSLKNLENQEERDPNAQKRRMDDQARARATAPWADKLKSSEYTKKLFDEAALAGHRMRAKVYMSWLDSTLHLEAKGRKLELRPTPEGISAVFLEPDGETRTEPLNLESDPADLIRQWLG
jgi:hypothetical protein